MTVYVCALFYVRRGAAFCVFFPYFFVLFLLFSLSFPCQFFLPCRLLWPCLVHVPLCVRACLRACCCVPRAGGAAVASRCCVACIQAACRCRRTALPRSSPPHTSCVPVRDVSVPAFRSVVTLCESPVLWRALSLSFRFPVSAGLFPCSLSRALLNCQCANVSSFYRSCVLLFPSKNRTLIGVRCRRRSSESRGVAASTQPVGDLAASARRLCQP